MKAHDSASFNIYACTMSWQIVLDRLDDTSNTQEDEAGSPTHKLKQVEDCCCLRLAHLN